MLECQNCHHDVICTFHILEKYKRFWLDLDQNVLFSSGVGQSLRVISEPRFCDPREEALSVSFARMRESSLCSLLVRLVEEVVDTLHARFKLASVYIMSRALNLDGTAVSRQKLLCLLPGRIIQCGSKGGIGAE